MKSSSVLLSEKKRVFKYDSINQKILWNIEFDESVIGISRVNKYTFVSTQSNWGKNFTTLIHFESGEIFWKLDEILYSIHILEETIIFINKTKKIVSISLKTGEENFSVKMGFSWYESPKMALINNKIYLFSLKKTKVLNHATGSISESELPSKLNNKKITFIIDEFQININNLSSDATGNGTFHDIVNIGDVGGDGGGSGDFGGVDAGG